MRSPKKSDPPVKKIGLLRLAKMLVRSASKVYPHPGRRFIKDKVKYCLRGMAKPGLTQKWFQLLDEAGVASAIPAHPRLLSKLQRPYLHRNRNTKERLEVLGEHYSFVKERFPAAAVEAIYSASGLRLADVPLGDAGNFSLRLIYLDQFEKEGELTVALANEVAGVVVFAAAFSVLASAPEARELFIGGIQSIRGEKTKELMVAITREMYGLRPKALLLFTLQQLAKAWGMASIRAVSNDTSVFQDFRLRKKLKIIAADYDEFWRESDGLLGDDGFFTLPTSFIPRPMTDIKANKRSLYKKRYIMLDEIARQIVFHLSELDLCFPAPKIASGVNSPETLNLINRKA